MATADESEEGLASSGERYMPGMVGNIQLEHVHRYLLARELVRNRKVLDMACGEGYGSDLLATVASSVIGVDVAPEVIRHAGRRYGRAGLTFVIGSCTAIPLSAESVDVVVSFETLEHVSQHDDVMREVKRVLRPGGVLIISSPERREYSDLPAYRNPFHVRELYRDEFEQLLKTHFSFGCLVGQRIRAGSVVGPLGSASEFAFVTFGDLERPERRCDGLETPLYLIGVATDGKLPSIPIGLLDGGEFLWARDHDDAMGQLREQHSAKLNQLDSATNERESTLSALKTEVDRQTALITSLTVDKAKAEERNYRLHDELGLRDDRVRELDAERTQLQQSFNEEQQALHEAQRELASARQRLQTLEARLRTADHEHHAMAALEERLAVMESSRSWRLTAPLRGLRRFAEGALFRQRSS